MLLPYIMRQRMQEQYLESSSAQYEKLAKLKDELYRRSQLDIQNKASEHRIKGEMVRAGIIGVKDVDRPLLELIERLGVAGVTGPGIPTPKPGLLEEKKRPYGDIMAKMSGALEQAEYLPTEEVGPATGLLGSKRVMEFLEQAGRERRVGKELGLREREVAVSEKEVGLKGEPKGKGLEDQLKFLDGKEKTFEAQLKSIGTELGETIEELKTSDDPKVVDLNKRIEKVRKRKLNIYSQLLGDLDKKKSDEIISKLRSGGATVEALEKYKERFKKEEKLTEEEFQYIILNLR